VTHAVILTVFLIPAGLGLWDSLTVTSPHFDACHTKKGFNIMAGNADIVTVASHGRTT